MFWVGLLIGLFVGTQIGFLGFSICVMGSWHEAEEQSVPVRRPLQNSRTDVS